MTKALVVQENPLNLELVLEILHAQGFNADEAHDGKDAIKKIEQEFYDLILMDVSLPGMNGIEVTRTIKSMSLYKDVPVIALTAYAMKGDRERFLESGFDDYIPKPIDVYEFMKKMETYKD